MNNMVRKKNLKAGAKYTAQVRAQDPAAADGWGPFSPECTFITLGGSEKRMESPSILVADGEGITVQWKEASGVATYEVQWRSDLHSGWEVASNSIKGTAVRKKNLQVGPAHYFRVRPSSLTNEGDISQWAMSPPSQSASLSILSPFLRSIFGSPDAKCASSHDPSLSSFSHVSSVRFELRPVACHA